MGAALGRGRTSFGVAFFPKELPVCAMDDDDVQPIDSAVRVEGSLLIPHTMDTALKYSPLKACLQTGRISEFSNQA